MKRHAHIVGAGGTGMSALAQLLLALGWRVTGSDRALDQGVVLDNVEILRRAGLEVHRQDGSAIGPDTAAVVFSSAVEDDNPDRRQAAALRVPCVLRAQLLADLARPHRVVAIAGTAGKTTVTGMLGWICEQAEMDPTVVNGGAVPGWRRPDNIGNVRIGRSELWIVETDESDRSFLLFEPAHAVITNISQDHFDLEETGRLFREFCGRVKEDILAGPGVAGICGAQPRLHEAEGAVRRAAGGWIFDTAGRTMHVPQPGRHNAENARLGAAMALRLGIAPDTIAGALAAFPGIERRLERVGEKNGVRVIDDYAHNPAKIRASWEAVAENAPRILGVWRPHGFKPLAAMFDLLVDTLADLLRPADQLFLLPVFYGGGTVQRTVESADLAAALVRRGKQVQAVPDYPTLESALRTCQRPGDVILLMGARDPEMPRFARKLVE